MKRFVNDQSGAALVVALIAFVVVSILSVALLDLSNAETRFAQHQENKTQAYYIAHSAADALATYIIRNPENLPANDMKVKVESMVNQSTPETPLAGGTFKVDVLPVGTTGYKVLSTGTFRGTSQTTSINLTKRGLFENAVYAHRNLILWSGAKVYGGDVQYGETYSQGNNAQIMDGSPINGKLDYPYNEFPTLPPYAGLTPPANDLTIGNHTTIQVVAGESSGDQYLEKSYDVISMSSHGTLRIELNGQTVKMVVNEFYANGTLEIVDSSVAQNGKLLLYVRKEVYFKGIVNSMEQNLIVFIGDYHPTLNPSGNNGYMELKTGNAKFNGFIVGITAQIDITANLIYRGAIIADTVKVASGAGLYFDKDIAATIVPSEIFLPSLGYKLGNWTN